MIAKISEVSKTEVKCKKLNNLDGPIYILPISKIRKIKYESNLVEIFSEELSDPNDQLPIFSLNLPEDVDTRNKDVIVTRNGKVIYCFIGNISKTDVLHYQIIRRGKDKTGSIRMAQVSAYKRKNEIKNIAPLIEGVTVNKVH